MRTLFSNPSIETEAPGNVIFLVPKVDPIVYVPVRGYSPEEMRAAETDAIVEAYTQAARRGEVATITNIEWP